MKRILTENREEVHERPLNGECILFPSSIIARSGRFVIRKLVNYALRLTRETSIVWRLHTFGKFPKRNTRFRGEIRFQCWNSCFFEFRLHSGFFFSWKFLSETYIFSLNAYYRTDAALHDDLCFVQYRVRRWRIYKTRSLRARVPYLLPNVLILEQW